MGHELNQKECLFEPKLIINLTNITLICSSNATNTYFLTNAGNIYFCGQYYDINNEECFQLLPKLINIPKTIKLLQMIKSFGFSKRSILFDTDLQRKAHSIAVFIINNIIFELKYNGIEENKIQIIARILF